MKLLALGVDYHSASTALREALAFDEAARWRALDELGAAWPGCERVVLSTCNRVELYLATDAPEVPQIEELTNWLVVFHGTSAEPLAGHLVAHHDEAVVGHLFRVAASLESLVLGEGQILGQVRDAYRAAVERQAVGPILHSLFQQALRVGKRVREETGMDQGRLSIASVAVDLAQAVFDSFRDKTVLVIGAGKMAELTLRHLATLQPGQILVTNRSDNRAIEMARHWAAQPVSFADLDGALADADVVVSTTAADQPIVEYARYAQLQRKQRGGRLALILDIAVPRDFDPRIGDLDQVLLYNIDDLRGQVEQNLRHRRDKIEPAQAIIERETTACLAEIRHQRHAGSLLRQLGDYGDAIAARELERFFDNCPDLTDSQRSAAEHLVHRLKNQFLHHPRAAVRSVASELPGTHSAQKPGDLHPILSAVKHLFGLGDTPAPGHHAPAKPDRAASESN
jgi:glutamyl-tRNA reductase